MEAIGRLVERQWDFFERGGTRPLAFRREQLRKLGEAIERHESFLLDALYQDLHKSQAEAYLSEIGNVRQEIKHMLKNLERFNRPKAVKTPLIYFGAQSFIQPEPLGVALILAPWNYPFQLSVSPLVGAISAGNCAVVKPSELAPHLSAALARMLRETFPEEYVAVVEGDAEASRALLAEKWDTIFYTGGPTVGRIVMEAAAKHLTPVTLELGGKSPCIVDREVPLETVARRIVWGKFLNAGQTCVAPDYLLVEHSIEKPLLEALKGAIRAQIPDPAEYARIISERHFDRLVGLLDHQSVVFGGEHRREEKYLAPTLVADPSPDSPLMQEEIFGPILPIVPYRELEEAIAFVNLRPKPLALYFFSRNRAKQERVLERTSSGGVCLNDTVIHITPESLPFGGVGESGMGAYHGQASFDTFSHRKSVLRNTLLFDLKLKYPPYRLSLSMLKRMLRLL